MGALEVHGLTRHLGGRPVLDNVSFRIEDGEFFVLLGPSGGGKSTLLRLICGLDQPESGYISINERDVTKLPSRERNLGMVFQDYGLYPNMNAFQNIAYGLEARRLPNDEIKRRVTEASRMLGLSDLLERTVVDLSGGEQQRVALARALAKDADAYLFDEPLSNLDPKLRHRARQDIMTLHKQKRKPSLYVTHDQSEAFAMADRIAIIYEGRLQQVDAPHVILDHPANTYVARFTGWPGITLLEGSLRHVDGCYQLVLAGLNVPMPDYWNGQLAHYQKDRVLIGIRPQAIGLATHTTADEQPVFSFSGQVEDVEALIGESVVQINVGGKTNLVGLIQDDSGIVVMPGTTQQFWLAVDQICLFDLDSEQAL